MPSFLNTSSDKSGLLITIPANSNILFVKVLSSEAWSSKSTDKLGL